jgi:hypothetical protein
LGQSIASYERLDPMIQQKVRPSETDEAFFDQLGADLDVIVHRRQTTDPFVSELSVTAPVDVLWLMGRREDHEIEPSLRGVDE